MDVKRIQELARQHAVTLAEAHDAAASTPDRVNLKTLFDQQLPVLWQRLDDASVRYCEAYNAGFGLKRLTAANHKDGINVFAADDSRFAARLLCDVENRRFVNSGIEGLGSFEPFDISFMLIGDKLQLTLDGHPIAEENLVERMLDRFTTALIERNRSEV